MLYFTVTIHLLLRQPGAYSCSLTARHTNYRKYTQKYTTNYPEPSPNTTSNKRTAYSRTLEPENRIPMHMHAKTTPAQSDRPDKIGCPSSHVLDATHDDHSETVRYNTNKHAAEKRDPVHDAIMSRLATQDEFKFE